MDKYASEYGDRIRYGRLRERSEWQPFADKMYDERKEDHGQHLLADLHRTSRLVLADFLDDEGDPRAEIVRRATVSSPLEGRSVPADFDDNTANVHSDRLSDGSTLMMSARTSSPNGTAADHVYVNWMTRTSKNFPIGHGAYFAPDEARAFADRLPEEHGSRLHAFLDRHFGPRS